MQLLEFQYGVEESVTGGMLASTTFEPGLSILWVFVR